MQCKSTKSLTKLYVAIKKNHFNIMKPHSVGPKYYLINRMKIEIPAMINVCSN